MVVAGFIVGSQQGRRAMSDEMEGSVDKFWELIDMMRSALLFVLMGTEMLVLNISG